MTSFEAALGEILEGLKVAISDGFTYAGETPAVYIEDLNPAFSLPAVMLECHGWDEIEKSADLKVIRFQLRIYYLHAEFTLENKALEAVQGLAALRSFLVNNQPVPGYRLDVVGARFGALVRAQGDVVAGGFLDVRAYCFAKNPLAVKQAAEKTIL